MIRRLFGAFGALIGFLVGNVLSVRRAHVIESMRRAGIGAPEAVARRMYASLGRGLVELIATALGSKSLAPLVEFDPILLDRLPPGGAVIATAHTGNFDLVACAAAERIPLTVVTKHFTFGALDRLWQRLRARRGVRLVAAGDAARVARVALGRSEYVAMLVDQAPERRRGTIVAPFLGAPARIDLGPALVALRARVPLVAVFARRLSDGRQRVELAAYIEPPRRPHRLWAELAMLRVTDSLDTFVRRHPEEWLWMHRRWKDVGQPAQRAPANGTVGQPAQRAAPANESVDSSRPVRNRPRQRHAAAIELAAESTRRLAGSAAPR